MKSRHAELYQISFSILFRQWFLKVSNSNHRFISQKPAETHAAEFSLGTRCIFPPVMTHSLNLRKRASCQHLRGIKALTPHTHMHPQDLPFKRLW